MRVIIAIEKFHPLTVVYPDLDIIPAGSEIFIQLPPVSIDFGAAIAGLIDQHVVADYPLYGYTMKFEEDTPLTYVAGFITNGQTLLLLEETWNVLRKEHAGKALAAEAPRSMALIAIARSLGHEF